MIVVDTSALVSLALDEPSSETVLSHFQTAERLELSLASYLEAVLVLRAKQPLFELDRFQSWIRELEVGLVEVDQEQAAAAAIAAIRFGKGTGHPARLNFGDCFAYGLAKVRRAPLLFVGNDFTHTDIESALA